MKATESYQKNKKEVESLLKKVTAGIKKLDTAQKKKPDDWGYSGSMSHVKAGLQEIVRFLGQS